MGNSSSGSENKSRSRRHSSGESLSSFNSNTRHKFDDSDNQPRALRRRSISYRRQTLGEKKERRKWAAEAMDHLGMVGLLLFGRESARSTELPVDSSYMAAKHYDHLSPFDVQYAIVAELGSGAFSTVYKCTKQNQRSVGAFYALKEIDLRSLSIPQVRSIRFEINILSQLQKHPNIVQFQCIYSKSLHLYLVLEHLAGGELLDAICSLDRYTEEHVKEIMYQLVDAVRYMHARQVIHRDLRPDIIMVKNVDIRERMVVKIMDVGYAMVETLHSHKPQHFVFGTPGFMAPEVIAQTVYTPACDVWALGVVFYVLLSGIMPFSKSNPGRVLSGQFAFPENYFSTVSGAAKELIEDMLEVTWTDRPTAREVLTHEWFESEVRRQREALSGATSSADRTASNNSSRRVSMFVRERLSGSGSGSASGSANVSGRASANVSTRTGANANVDINTNTTTNVSTSEVDADLPTPSVSPAEPSVTPSSRAHRASEGSDSPTTKDDTAAATAAATASSDTLHPTGQAHTSTGAGTSSSTNANSLMSTAHASPTASLRRSGDADASMLDSTERRKLSIGRARRKTWGSSASDSPLVSPSGSRRNSRELKAVNAPSAHAHVPEKSLMFCSSMEGGVEGSDERVDKLAGEEAGSGSGSGSGGGSGGGSGSLCGLEEGLQEASDRLLLAVAAAAAAAAALEKKTASDGSWSDAVSATHSTQSQVQSLSQVQSQAQTQTQAQSQAQAPSLPHPQAGPRPPSLSPPSPAQRPRLPGDLTGNLPTLRQYAMVRRFRTAATQLKTRNPSKRGKQGVLMRPKKKSLVHLYLKLQGGEGALGEIAEEGAGGRVGAGAGAGAGAGTGLGTTGRMGTDVLRQGGEEDEEEEEEEEEVTFPAGQQRETAREALMRKLSTSAACAVYSYANDPVVRALGGLPDSDSDSGDSGSEGEGMGEGEGEGKGEGEGGDDASDAEGASVSSSRAEPPSREASPPLRGRKGPRRAQRRSAGVAGGGGTHLATDPRGDHVDVSESGGDSDSGCGSGSGSVSAAATGRGVTATDGPGATSAVRPKVSPPVHRKEPTKTRLTVGGMSIPKMPQFFHSGQPKSRQVAPGDTPAVQEA